QVRGISLGAPADQPRTNPVHVIAAGVPGGSAIALTSMMPLRMRTGSVATFSVNGGGAQPSARRYSEPGHGQVTQPSTTASTIVGVMGSVGAGPVLPLADEAAHGAALKAHRVRALLRQIPAENLAFFGAVHLA